MEISTTLANSIDTVNTCARYDKACKMILSEKIILAWIMKNTMEEYQSKPIQEIIGKYIVGVPEVASTNVLPETTNMPKITNIGTEDVSYAEGSVTFDIRFQALLPGTGELVGMIINVEAQNDFYPGYPLVKRAIYYCSRMISSQYGMVFTKSDYGKIKKVYSVWICINPPMSRKNTITRYSMTEHCLIGNARENIENYDLISVIMICLGSLDGTDKNIAGGLLKLLDVLLSNETDAMTKKRILEEDFEIPMTERMERGISEMCNLSEGVMTEGIRRGIEQGILESLKKLMCNLNLTLEQAMDTLEISSEDRSKYGELILK